MMIVMGMWRRPDSVDRRYYVHVELFNATLTLTSVRLTVPLIKFSSSSHGVARKRGLPFDTKDISKSSPSFSPDFPLNDQFCFPC